MFTSEMRGDHVQLLVALVVHVAKSIGYKIMEITTRNAPLRLSASLVQRSFFNCNRSLSTNKFLLVQVNNSKTPTRNLPFAFVFAVTFIAPAIAFWGPPALVLGGDEPGLAAQAA
jgi:hypothetical protein